MRQAGAALCAGGRRNSWPMPLERAFFESSDYAAVAFYVGGLIPTIYHYSPYTLLHSHGAFDATRHTQRL